MSHRPSLFEAADRELLIFYLLFLSAAGGLLAWPAQSPPGWRLFAAGVLFNLALPVFASHRVEPRWIRIWSFLLPLSALQILPDWYLVSGLGSLVFPDLGFPFIGPVSGFMALLWIIPLFVVVHVGVRVAEIRSYDAGGFFADGRLAGTLAAAGTSLVLFAAAEATLTLIPVWQAVGVTTLGPVALYVLPAETLLGGAAFLAYHSTQRRPVIHKLIAAALVMAIYLLGLELCHRLFEG